ncbi:hypothetical protein PINS_up007136 [Pythium insidiosum]|nr:hypothetical protein PINS_up007136 [Pythium insidiosum]
MKRAVQEARELKKELMLMRQEKEEQRSETRKATLAAATTPTPGGVTTKEDLQKQLTKEKTKHKELQTEITRLQQALEETTAAAQQRETEWQRQVAEKEKDIEYARQETLQREHEARALQEELKKQRAATEDTKRKLQRATKEKKEELQRLLEENEQLAKRNEELQRHVDDAVKLRRQVDRAKEKQSSVAEEWQRKLEQREQAFLRQEEANRRELLERQQAMDAMQTECQSLRDRVTDLEGELAQQSGQHERRLRDEEKKRDDMLVAMAQLQERLLTLKDAGRAADRARLDAEARLAKETELREIAEAAADAVESRTSKLEQRLCHATEQLAQVERALQKKGITLDYLLKRGGTSNNAGVSPRDREDGLTPAPSSAAAAVIAKRMAQTKAKAVPEKEKPSREPQVSVPVKPHAGRLARSSTSISIGSNNNNNHDARER